MTKAQSVKAVCRFNPCTAQQICDAEVKAGIVKYCPMCGQELKPGSISYFEGYHIDGCE